MAKKNKVSSRRVGLDIGLSIGRFFLNTEDLHYGYWPDGEKATVQNFAQAQKNHSQLILDHIPNGTKRILDVGSGSGNLALKLINIGFLVDCVIPSEFLAEQVQAKLGKQSKIHICGFEELPLAKTYDLILFSESFQYVKLADSLQKAVNMLNPAGYLLICDFFKRDVPGKSPMGGGHSWREFQETISKLPFRQLMNIDISQETAPTIDLMARFNREVLSPIVEMSGEYLKDHYPRITSWMQWKYKKRIEKISRTHLSGKVTGDSFKQFKTYHLLLFQT